MVKELHATLHVLNTGKMGDFNPEVVYNLGLLQNKLKGIKPVCHILTNNNVDQGIIEFAENNKINLLIVLPQLHNLLDILFHTSHTKQFVLHCHVPVMALQC